ncbi:hypothetical protein DPMN_004400 [Dreissena polymorpha]|uniref:Uncharacterized protein n=1 Tax=Dreissena polymorpha TaxID=45954 RepID=A0A9D4RSY7_DREPO|nr:hypothetical protein DPMN_004400 [Dreissena polymorpha]
MGRSFGKNVHHRLPDWENLALSLTKKARFVERSTGIRDAQEEKDTSSINGTTTCRSRARFPGLYQLLSRSLHPPRSGLIPCTGCFPGPLAVKVSPVAAVQVPTPYLQQLRSRSLQQLRSKYSTRSGPLRQRGTNIILGHSTARIVRMRQPRHVLTRRIVEMRIDSASWCGSRLASACLSGKMRSLAAKCDLPPHTDAASTADLASTRCALPPRIAKYVCSALAVL